MALHLPSEEKGKGADFFVENTGTVEETRDRVLLLFDKIKTGGAKNLTY